MEEFFLDKEHKKKYNNLIARGTIKGDLEREVVMYILSGGKGLYDKVDNLYNFKENRFKFETVENKFGKKEIIFDEPLSSSERSLVLLALELYSGFNYVSILSIFDHLYDNNIKIALNSFKIKYYKQF